jgi:hypothetical protein
VRGDFFINHFFLDAFRFGTLFSSFFKGRSHPHRRVRELPRQTPNPHWNIAFLFSLYFTKEIRPLWSSLKAVQGGCGQSIHSAIRATFFRLPCPLAVQSSSIYLFLGRWRYVETLLQRCCCECFLDYWHYFPALLVEDRLKTVRPRGL